MRRTGDLVQPKAAAALIAVLAARVQTSEAVEIALSHDANDGDIDGAHVHRIGDRNIAVERRQTGLGVMEVRERRSGHAGKGVAGQKQVFYLVAAQRTAVTAA